MYLNMYVYLFIYIHIYIYIYICNLEQVHSLFHDHSVIHMHRSCLLHTHEHKGNHLDDVTQEILLGVDFFPLSSFLQRQNISLTHTQASILMT